MTEHRFRHVPPHGAAQQSPRGGPPPTAARGSQFEGVRFRVAVGLTASGSVGRREVRTQRRPKELYFPFCTEGVERRFVWHAVPHRTRKLREECRRVEGRGHDDKLPGGSVRDVDEAMGRAAGDADDIARLGEEAPSVDLIEVAPLHDAKDFRFRVAVLRRALARRVDRLEETELATAHRRRKADEQIKPDSGNFYRRLCPMGVKEGYAHLFCLEVRQPIVIFQFQHRHGNRQIKLAPSL